MPQGMHRATFSTKCEDGTSSDCRCCSNMMGRFILMLVVIVMDDNSGEVCRLGDLLAWRFCEKREGWRTSGQFRKMPLH